MRAMLGRRFGLSSMTTKWFHSAIIGPLSWLEKIQRLAWVGLMGTLIIPFEPRAPAIDFFHKKPSYKIDNKIDNKIDISALYGSGNRPELRHWCTTKS